MPFLRFPPCEWNHPARRCLSSHLVSNGHIASHPWILLFRSKEAGSGVRLWNTHLLVRRFPSCSHQKETAGLSCPASPACTARRILMCLCRPSLGQTCAPTRSSFEVGNANKSQLDQPQTPSKVSTPLSKVKSLAYTSSSHLILLEVSIADFASSLGWEFAWPVTVIDPFR